MESNDNLRLSQTAILIRVTVTGVSLAAFAFFAIRVDRARVEPAVTPAVESATLDRPSPELDSGLALHPTTKNLRYDAAIRDIVVREDPLADGWDTEEFSELVDRQLNEIANLLGDPAKFDEQRAKLLCTPNFRGRLRPEELAVAYEDNSFTVRRGASSTPVEGTEGFLQCLQEQQIPLTGVTTSRYKFKIIRVEEASNGLDTTALFEISGSKSTATTQINATWKCRWETQPDGPPQLNEVSVTDYEEIMGAAPIASLFSDCTKSVFAHTPEILHEQFVYGRDHWYGKVEGSIGVEGRGNGIAIGDANGDGVDDIYICQPAALPNRLFVRRDDGTVNEVAASAGVDYLDGSRSALFVDIDNDGDQDLIVTQEDRILLHENDGGGSFSLRETVSTQSRLFSINAVDYDNDGDLDLFACGYSASAQTRPDDIFVSPVPYHDANNGAPNIMLQNEGAWAFTDVTQVVGLDANNLRFSLASAWEDFDNDGDQDLYVANDFGRNNLYRNDDGRFVDIAAEADVEDIGPGMSAAWGDYDNDGRSDLYVSNMFSSAGSRITHDPKFKPNASQTDIGSFQRHARGNSLFRNTGDGTFSDLSIASGTTMGRWAWGSLFVDINNDGRQDLYVTNGFVTSDNNNDL